MVIKDLLTFLSKEKSGASFGDIQKEFSTVDKSEIKRLIESGIFLENIYKEGEKRGTKYFLNKGIDVSNIKDVEDDNHDYEFDQDSSAISKILESKTPINGQGVYSTIEKIIPEEDSGSLVDYLKYGLKQTTVYISYDKLSGKNKIVHENIDFRFNQVSIVNRENEILLILNDVIDNTRSFRKSFDKYEDLAKFLKDLVKQDVRKILK